MISVLFPFATSVPHTNYGLLELSRIIQVEELAGSKRKHHALIVLLQLVVDLCGDQGRELPVWERFIFVECLTAICQQVYPSGLATSRRRTTAWQVPVYLPLVL